MFLGLILAGTFVFAVGKASGADSWYDAAKVGAARIQAWVTSSDFNVDEILKKIPNPGELKTGSSGSAGSSSDATITPSAATKTLDKISVANASTVKYNRDDWKHWNNLSPSCWNIRDEVLFKQGTDIVLLDKDKKKTTDKKKACSVASGTWNDPYTGKKFTDPGKLDIDHVIPLGYTHRQGGAEWSASKKQEYANSMNAGHLLAVSASANRSKSDGGPSVWMPSNKAYTCSYAKNWVSVASTWKLTLAKSDAAALKKALSTC